MRHALCVCRAGVIVDELVAVFGGFRVFGRFVRLFRKANFKAVRTGRTDVLVVGIHACFAQQCTLQNIRVNDVHRQVALSVLRHVRYRHGDLLLRRLCRFFAGVLGAFRSLHIFRFRRLCFGQLLAGSNVHAFFRLRLFLRLRAIA